MTDAQTLEAIAALGEGIESILKSDAFNTGLTLARGRIFENWSSAATVEDREKLHAEMCALDRLLEAFKTLDEEGVVAREAIRQMQESDTDL